MRCGRWMTGLTCGCLLVVTGCVSLADYHRVEAQNRRMGADMKVLDTELFDERAAADALRTRVDSLERERVTKDELLANLRGENELLDEMRRTAQAALEDMAGRATLSDIHITGPKLPEQLDSALTRFAEQHPSAVSYDAAHGTVKWKSDLLFALGSDVVNQSSLAALRGFTEVIRSPAAEDFEVIVVGHTDSRPISKPSTKAKHPSNWHLSAHRAISVARVLQENDYPGDRVGVMGCGQFRPVADNGTAEGASQNRRVEIYLLPRGAIVSATAGIFPVIEGKVLTFATLLR